MVDHADRAAHVLLGKPGEAVAVDQHDGSVRHGGSACHLAIVADVAKTADQRAEIGAATRFMVAAGRLQHDEIHGRAIARRVGSVIAAPRCPSGKSLW